MASKFGTHRTCTACKVRIQVGRNKLGRAVFAGGICYDCWRRTGDKKKAKVA